MDVKSSAISLLEHLRSTLHDDLVLVERQLEEILASRFPIAKEALFGLCHAGGKRIRPILTLLAGKTTQDKAASRRLIGVAAKIEAIHLISLIHDDVVDEATTRRYSKTINFTYGNKFAVLLGDIAYARLFNILVEEYDSKVMDILAKVVIEIAEGALQETIALDSLELSEEEYIEIITNKTASLFGAALRLGVLASGINADTMPWDNVGRQLGLVYQIVDDILDVADDADLGKPRFKDLPGGRLTLPVIHLLRESKADATSIVKSVMNGNNGDQEHLLKLLRDTGSIAYAQNLAVELSNSAMQSLEELPPSPFKQQLMDILSWLPKRII